MVAAAYLSPELLNDLVRRIVEVAHPLRIVLFGSAARGQMGPHSDLDLLVVIRDDQPYRETEDRIWQNMWGLAASKDIVVVTEEDVRRHGTNPYLIIHTALSEGRELYRGTN